MAYTDNISRLSRLTAIHLKLQSNSYVSVEQLTEQFNISIRTVYRDLAALEQANVPIVTVEGKAGISITIKSTPKQLQITKWLFIIKFIGITYFLQSV